MWWIIAGLVVVAFVQARWLWKATDRHWELHKEVARLDKQQRDDYWRQEARIRAQEVAKGEQVKVAERLATRIDTVGRQLNDLGLTVNDVVRYDVSTRWHTEERAGLHRLYIHHSQKPTPKGGPERGDD